jgi:hypothetical protein
MSALVPYSSYPVGMPNTGIIPRVAQGAANAMRNVTPAAQAAARLTTTAGAAGAAGIGARKAAGRVLVAKTAYDLARLGLSEDARNEAAAQVEIDAANANAAGRFAAGLLDPVNTAYGITRLTRDAIDSTRAAEKAAAAAPTDEQIAAKYQQSRDKKAKDAERLATLLAEQDRQDQEAAAKKGFGAAVEDRLAAMMQDQLSPKELATFTPSERESARLQDELTPEELASFSTEEDLAMQALTPEQRAEMAKMTDADYENAPKAKPVYDPALVNSLFKTAFGTDINPKREKDIKKVEAIEELLGERGGKLGKATPSQFALEVYRRYGSTIM